MLVEAGAEVFMTTRWVLAIPKRTCLKLELWRDRERWRAMEPIIKKEGGLLHPPVLDTTAGTAARHVPGKF